MTSAPTNAQTARPIGLSIRAQPFALSPATTASFVFALSPEVMVAITPPTTTTTPPTDDAQPDPPAPAPAPPQLSVTLSYHPAITQRSQITDALNGQVGGAIDQLSFPLDSIMTTSGEEHLIELTAPIVDGLDADTADVLHFREPGIYPVSVEIRRDAALVARSTTLVEYLNPDRPGRGPLHLAIVSAVPDPGPSGAEPDLQRSVAELAALTELTAQLDAPITMSIPASIVLGETAPMVTKLGEVLTNADTVTPTAVDPIDPSSAAAINITEIAEDQLDRGQTMLSNAIRTKTPSRAGWIIDSPLTIDGAQALYRSGFKLLIAQHDDIAHTISVAAPDTGIDQGITSQLLTIAHDDFSLPVIGLDPINSLLDPTTSPVTTPLENAVEYLATASLMRYTGQPKIRGMIVSSPSIGVPDIPTLAALEPLVQTHPDITFSDLETITTHVNPAFANGNPVPYTLATAPKIDLRARVATFNQVSSNITAPLSMLTADSPHRAGWPERLRRSLSTQLTTKQARVLTNEVAAEAAGIADAVQPPSPFEFNLSGGNTEFPLRLSNTAHEPVTVVITVTGDRVSAAQPLTATIAPGSTDAIQVKVQSFGNGVSPVTVRLATPSGDPIGEPIELTARVRALGGLGRALTSGSVIILLTWWFTHFRKIRKQRISKRHDETEPAH